ncbi:nuclear transport factor 2 family protein [Sphingomonas sp. SUN039]|uniref:nuclear transport factor 2 family protein n=1 Tax=Sphingomonas sp. SUN039 TaxID=2937787 RepID=UPI0021643CFA|nr:nuclear transport factor 2 family protein [Sphingomonas sp. SUN039]UVO52625.1 nuclear transport factor 2 family protein [Sphingomonas sp. SUN039]
MTDLRLQNLLDRQDILDCLTRFSRGMDRFDRAIYLSAFHDDAVIAAGPFVGSAADCWDWAKPMHEAGQVLTHHSLLNNTVEIDGDTAHSETYYQFVARNHPWEEGGGETVMLAGGRYIDRLERRGGAWKIALRTNIIEWSCIQPAMPLPFGDVPDIGANGVSARDQSDPSYQRPLLNVRKANVPR